METHAPKAVFLSYAREDATAARRVAEALRSSGIEVWLDENELRGGDAWDQKIRRQIKDCSLFLAIISAHTQERGEGYFRLEWKLAVDRTDLMAEGVPFLVPVVIDDTPESGASVPEPFMHVQWIRLPGALPTPQFVEQAKHLLAAPRRGASASPSVGVASSASARGKSGLPARILGALAVVVVSVAVAVFLPRKPVLTVSDKSIAVLPFANMSAEKGNEFFADGVHEDVITNLAKIRDLKVIARTSVLAYRDTASRNLKKIAAELGVATVLEGSVRRAGNQVRVTAQLINARTDEHLWAESYDGDLTDVFALQAKLAREIAGALKATLTTRERALIERKPTQNQEAYDLYLRARAMHQDLGERGTPADFERVISVYEQAIAKDPSFALAHAQVSLAHDVMYWFSSLDPSPARAAKAKAAVDTAVRLAPDLPETRLALGAYYYRVHRDWNRALAEFRVAEAGLPNDAQLVFWLAITHRRLGKWTEALGYFEHAIVLNPRDLASVWNYTGFLATLRRWEQARDATVRFLASFPAERDLLEGQAQSRFALNGDRAAYAGAIATLPRLPADPAGLSDTYRAALLNGDYAAADQALADPRLVNFRGTFDVITEPVSLHRAFTAFLRGDRETARRFADQAIAFYRAGPWNVRQQPWMQMGIAMAEAWAGRSEEAIRDAQAAVANMTAQDALDTNHLRQLLGTVYVALGRREEAIACLREMMSGPCALSPNEIRADPLWARLKDDPRFEEILESAKPL